MGYGTRDNMNWAGLLQNILVLAHLREIVCGSIRFSMPEEQEAGLRIGTLGRDYPPPYRLLTQEYLWMDKNTGDIYTTTQRVDREAICSTDAQAKECIISHNAIVGPSGDLIQFPVVVEDINDNAPRFENSEIRISVSEDAAVGSRFPIDDRAQDEDVGRNGELLYHLEGSSGTFGLVEEEGLFLVLVVQEVLDRETREEHRMTLVVTDHGLEPLSATVALIIRVTDINDNCPIFAPDSPHRVTVRGGSPRGTVVAQIRATDSDTGPNAVITYSFSPKVSERIKTLFRLDKQTGHISLIQDLQSDSAEELVLKVLAIGYHCPPTDTQVTVSVLPTASRGPAIKIGFIVEHENQTIVLPEQQPPTVLAILELTGDRSFEGTSLFIEGDVPFSLSQQNGKYLLSTSKPLDYETKREYHVALAVRGPFADSSVSSRPERVIRVLVADVNDNAPQFLQAHYQLKVEENNLPGATLLRVSASDADSGRNGRVTYSLGESAATIFKVDHVTGQLASSVPLDREQQDSHTFTVLARDAGSPPLESTATVTIFVLDRNDNAPSFLTTHFFFFVPENLPALAAVGRVAATDPDDGENGSVEVLVVNGTGPFVVDNTQGTLRCTNNVDRETEDRYELYLLARDHGQPYLTSVARVTIFVEDVNDNQPKVILPSSNLSCLTVSPATTAGSIVTKIYAVDEDSGLNSEITYTIAAREPAQYGSPFQLDPRSGNISLAQRLLEKHLGMHHLFIVVSDGGKPAPLHTTVWVNLLVNETSEPCHLDSVPRSMPYRLAQTPTASPPCEDEQGAASRAWLILLVGLGMVLSSICLFVATVVLYLKQRKKRAAQDRRAHVEENEISLRLKEKYYSDD